MLFPNISLKFFVYDMIDVFSFPTEEVKMIYDKYDIRKCYMYLNLTDRESCLCFFNFICSRRQRVKKFNFWDFKTIKNCRNIRCFWTILVSIWNTQRKHEKTNEIYEIEKINNASICTIAVNPKEHFEKFKNRTLNKKHKGVRRETKGINFESYAERIATLKEPDKESNKKQIV